MTVQFLMSQSITLLACTVSYTCWAESSGRGRGQLASRAPGHRACLPQQSPHVAAARPASPLAAPPLQLARLLPQPLGVVVLAVLPKLAGRLLELGLR